MSEESAQAPAVLRLTERRTEERDGEALETWIFDIVFAAPDASAVPVERDEEGHPRTSHYLSMTLVGQTDGGVLRRAAGSVADQITVAGANIWGLSAVTPELFRQLRDALSRRAPAGLRLVPPDALPARPPPLALPIRERPPDYIPAMLPQQTFPEAKALAIGMADGPKLRRWKPVEGEIALWHQAEKAAIKTKIVGQQLLDWLGLPATVESLREELRQAGLPSVLLLHTVLGASLERVEKNRLFVTVAVDDLITAIGWKPRSAREREQRRRQVWRWLAILDSCQVIGHRPGKYRDPDSKQAIDLTSLDALIRITGQRKPAQLAFDNSAPPLEVTYVAGPWIERWRGQRHILTYFGDVRKLAAIPAGKPSGAWAQAIGLALQQKWRERAAYAQPRHVGQDKHLTVDVGTFTRRELLDLFPPEPTADDVLRSPNPRRAREYWRGAIALLKEHGVIGHYGEIDRVSAARQGWEQSWLSQRIEIRPPEAGAQAVAEIAKSRRAADRVRARRRAADTEIRRALPLIDPA